MADKKKMKKNMKGGENRKERADHLQAEEKAEVKGFTEEKAPVPEVKGAPEEKAPVPEAKGTPVEKAPVPEEKTRPGTEISGKIREARERRREEILQRRMTRRDEAEQRRVKFRESAKEMSDDLRQMLSKEIEEMNHREKTRGVEILGIFARHNFYAGGFTPLELRTTLEDLGPTFVKIGQIMSSRVDILPESYCRELERLRQNVKPLESEVARAVIEQETGKKIEEIYSVFNDDPIGSASIGQVHSGVLLDGTKVVTKVQRPLIADQMRKDLELLKKLAAGVNTFNEGKEDSGEQVDLLEVLSELEKVTNEELDFRVEAENTIFFKEHCIEDETKIACPTIYPELTTERIMTMSFVDGYSIAKKDRMEQDGVDPNEIGAQIVDNFVHQVLDVGFFHGDPHQGNLMVSCGIPYWIDFGMVGRLSNAHIKGVQDLIFSVVEADTEALVDVVMGLGAASPETDRAKLTEDLDGLISRYMSVTNLADLDMALLLDDLSNIMGTHHIKIPGAFTMLIRSIATIEGVIEQLCPDLNLFEMIANKVMDRAKQSIDIQQTLLSAGKDALSLGKKAAKIPGLAADVLNSVVKGRAKVNLELTGYQPILDQLADTVKSVVLGLFSCVIFFGSCILCLTDVQPQVSAGMPLVAMFGFIFSIALGIFTVKRLKGK